MKEILLTEKEMAFLVFLYFHDLPFRNLRVGKISEEF